MLAALAVLAAMTLAPTDVTATSATFHGTVDTPGTAYFQYGTSSTSYSKSTSPQAADGDVSAHVDDLAANTTYHVRLVSDSGNGNDVQFTTAANPKPPTVGNQHATAVTETGVHLSATLNPQGAATTYYFQYGRSAGYGNRSARITVPAGTTQLAVAADVTGLRPYSLYHWRIYATNSAGKTPGRDHTFRTARLATAVTLFADHGTVAWGRGVMLGGRVTGAGTNGMTLALQQDAFPFQTGFTTLRTTHASRDGGYLFSVDNVWTLTRYRVVSQTLHPLASVVAAVRAKARPTIGVRLLGRKRARISGKIRPAVTGELALQRRKASGGWTQIRRRALTDATRYSFKVWRARKVNRAYRVVVLPVKGAYSKAKTRAVVVSRRPGRARGHRAAAG
jgi:hypothetical protein